MHPGKAVAHLFKAAELGHGFAQQLVATQYYREQPFNAVFELPKDYKLALHWASLASQQPDSESAGNGHLLLSFLYEKGQGVTVDIEKMKHHLEEGVRHNHANSMYFLGSRLLIGDAHYKQDCDRAFTLAQASAARGNANGHYLVGHIYHQWKDPMTGKFRFRKPADLEYNGWTHHILHNYFLAYQKGVRNDEATRFLTTFLKWQKVELDGGSALFRKASPGFRLPSEVFSKLQDEYATTAEKLRNSKIDAVP